MQFEIVEYIKSDKPKFHIINKATDVTLCRLHGHLNPLGLSVKNWAMDYFGNRKVYCWDCEENYINLTNKDN